MHQKGEYIVPKKESQIEYTPIIRTLWKITDYIAERIYGDC